MIKGTLCSLGIEKMLKYSFKTNAPARFRIHTDDQNLLQMVCQIFGAYYEDNCAAENRRDPVLSAILRKEASNIVKEYDMKYIISTKCFR